MKRLNMGCGNDIRPGWVNLDFVKKKGVDVVHNLNKTPYPFRENTFDHVECVEVLEHLDDTVRTMRELYRIVKPGGTVRITVPYYLAHTAWSNPEHKRAFNYHTFKYFIAGTEENVQHNIGITFRSGKIKMAYGKGLYLLNYVLSPLANRFPGLFEKTLIKSMFHPDGLQVVLTK